MLILGGYPHTCADAPTLDLTGAHTHISTRVNILTRVHTVTHTRDHTNACAHHRGHSRDYTRDHTRTHTRACAHSLTRVHAPARVFVIFACILSVLVNS